MFRTLSDIALRTVTAAQTHLGFPALGSRPRPCHCRAMPELPEVETVRGGLAPVLEGHRLARVEARRPDLRFPLPQNFVQQLTGATITSLTRRAKYLLARLDREDTLVMHLGMSGRFEIARPEGVERPRGVLYAAHPGPQHPHIVFQTQARARGTHFHP